MERKGSDITRFTVIRSEDNLAEKDEPSVTDTFLESPSPLGEYTLFIIFLVFIQWISTINTTEVKNMLILSCIGTFQESEPVPQSL